MFVSPRIILALGVALLPYTAYGQGLVINELLAANDSGPTDPDYGQTSDWLEIHNAGFQAVDLTGYHLSDDLGDPAKWRIPSGTTVPAGGFLLIWADGMDVSLHAGFRLSRAGESLGLYTPAGDPVDVVHFGEQWSDVSFGRLPDASAEWRFFDDPTPGAPNSTAGYLGVAPEPAVAPAGGMYASGAAVSLSSTLPGGTIRFTTDGSPPDESSQVYDEVLVVTANTVLRSAVFADGYAAGPIATHSYLVGERSQLPIVSLSTDPANFFDDEIGIYVVGTNGITGLCRNYPVNWNQDWERPIHVELFEPDGTLAFGIDAGVKIHGGCTRIYDQKSLAIFARRAYGYERIDYPVFEDRDLDSYNNLVLRSSAQDWWRTMFRDGMIQTLIGSAMDLETQAYRPALVFLNGEYWGIHNMREKQNEHYLADRTGLDPDVFEILDGNKANLDGQSSHYDELLAYVRSADMSRSESYGPLEQWMDVSSFVDYLVAEIYTANADWPGNNLKLWRANLPGERWRWAIFDMDFGFGGNGNGRYFSNTLALATDPNGSEWPNPPWSTELIRKLLENPVFRDEFVQRFAAHVSTTFATDHVLQVIDSLQANIAAEIPRHKERWPSSISYAGTWDELVDIMREFARLRPTNVRGHFYDHFGLAGSAWLHLSVTEPEGGRIEAHGVPMPGPNFSAVFFKDVPVRLTAIPNPGFEFAGWEGASSETTDTTSVVLAQHSSLTALFVADGSATDVVSAEPAENQLFQNYPNPFSGATRIDFELVRPAAVKIRVYDLLGRTVAQLEDQRALSGPRSLFLDDARLPSGVYFYTLRSANFVATRRMVVAR